MTATLSIPRRQLSWVNILSNCMLKIQIFCFQIIKIFLIYSVHLENVLRFHSFSASCCKLKVLYLPYLNLVKLIFWLPLQKTLPLLLQSSTPQAPFFCLVCLMSSLLNLIIPAISNFYHTVFSVLLFVFFFLSLGFEI